MLRPLVLLLSLCAVVRSAQPATKFDIQAALDALPATGGVVRIPPGTYEITAPLVIARGDVKLEGSGAATHIVNRNAQGQPALLLEHANWSKKPRDRNARLWRVTLAHFRISGTKQSGDGIRAQGVDEIYLEGVAVDHHGGNGIVLRDCYEDPRLVGNIMTYNAAAGVLL